MQRAQSIVIKEVDGWLNEVTSFQSLTLLNSLLQYS